METMSYHVLDPQSLPETDEYPCDRRAIADAAGTAMLHMATYEMAPSEQLPRTYHYHERREEAFFVHNGRLHVETPEEEYVVEAGSVFVAEPESPHRAFNPADADGSVTVFGVGAPRSDVAVPYDADEE